MPRTRRGRIGPRRPPNEPDGSSANPLLPILPHPRPAGPPARTGSPRGNAMASPSRPERDPDRPRKPAPAVAPIAVAPARAGKRMEEEDLGRPARARSGGAPRSGGMGLGARVGLATGLLTLLVMA